MDFRKFIKEIQYAIDNNYMIEIEYSDDYSLEDHIINWKYPVYKIKSRNINKIIQNLNKYFVNYDNYIIIMILKNKDIKHKIPIYLPIV